MQGIPNRAGDFHDIAAVRVLKHCTTRWLRLERAVNRLLLLWPALFAYFDRLSEKPNARIKRVAKILGNVETKICCQFLSASCRPSFHSQRQHWLI